MRLVCSKIGYTTLLMIGFVAEPTKESSQKDSTKVSSSAASQAEAGEVTSSTERDAESAPPAGASGGTENFAAELSKNNQLVFSVHFLFEVCEQDLFPMRMFLENFRTI